MADETEPAPAPNSRDRLVKLGFLVVILAVGVVFWAITLKDPELDGWETDLATAMAIAKNDGKTKVLVFLHAPKMSKPDKDVASDALVHDYTQNAYARMKLVRVHLDVRKSAEFTTKHKVDPLKTPVLMLLDAEGNVLSRHDGVLNANSFIEKVLLLPPEAALPPTGAEGS